MAQVALVHDYLTQRGGAERVVLSMLKAFPDAPLHTSVYAPERTYSAFRKADVRPSHLNRIRGFRSNHRTALPLLAQTFSLMRVRAEVVLCSSSGWAHGVRVEGRKVVYCHAPARWLYQGQRYLGSGRSGAKLALRMLRPYLLRWDRKAARSATRYLTQSTAVRDRIREAYGIEAEVLPAPYAMSPEGPTSSVAGLEPGFMLCVSRLLPYKNVEAACAAFADLPSQMLVVVGAGPGAQRLRRMVPRNVRVLGSVSDEQLRWLYANSSGLVAAGYEDYGLTPLEAAAFGKPAAVLRWGGYLDTVLEGETGVFFDQPAPREIRNAVTLMGGNGFHPDVIRAHAELYSEASFIRRLQEIVELETKLAGA